VAKVKRKVRVMVRGYLDEISAVDSPAAEGAVAVLAKRAPERFAKALADADRVLNGEPSALGADELEDALLDEVAKRAVEGEKVGAALLRLVAHDDGVTALAAAAARARGAGRNQEQRPGA